MNEHHSTYHVRCPQCNALQFIARQPWESVPADEANIAIKCWRRTCKRVIGLRPREVSHEQGS